MEELKQNIKIYLWLTYLEMDLNYNEIVLNDKSWTVTTYNTIYGSNFCMLEVILEK